MYYAKYQYVGRVLLWWCVFLLVVCVSIYTKKLLFVVDDLDVPVFGIYWMFGGRSVGWLVVAVVYKFPWYHDDDASANPSVFVVGAENQPNHR